jgi:hypothetical protein
LSVGTYPFARIRGDGAGGGAKGLRPRETGAEVATAYTRGRPTKVYLAFRGADYQIEVFDPTPGGARRIVAERRVVPVS